MNIQIKLGNTVDRNYRLVRTTAPKSYDGFGTIELSETYLNDREARLVLIAEEHFNWQTCRYASGLNGFDEDTDYISERDVIETLWTRLTNRV